MDTITAREVLARCANCATDDAVRAVVSVAVRAQEQQVGWGRLRLEALRALGRWLIWHAQPGAPAGEIVTG